MNKISGGQSMSERYAVGKEVIVRLISGGKVTIPEEVRIAYGIEKGDILVLEIKEVIKADKNKSKKK